MQKNNTGHYSRLSVVIDSTIADIQIMTELSLPSEAVLTKHHQQNSWGWLMFNGDKLWGDMESLFVQAQNYFMVLLAILNLH